MRFTCSSVREQALFHGCVGRSVTPAVETGPRPAERTAKGGRAIGGGLKTRRQGCRSREEKARRGEAEAEPASRSERNLNASPATCLTNKGSTARTCSLLMKSEKRPNGERTPQKRLSHLLRAPLSAASDLRVAADGTAHAQGVCAGREPSFPPVRLRMSPCPHTVAKGPLSIGRGYLFLRFALIPGFKNSTSPRFPPSSEPQDCRMGK